MYHEPSQGWRKVMYPGTRMLTFDDKTVESRIEFVKKIAHFYPVDGHLVSKLPLFFPAYHCLHSNCECFAVWIVTGSWSSLQGLDGAKLIGTTAGFVSGGIASAATLTTASVAVPATGLWGLLGFTTSVSLATACPILIPVSILGSAALGYTSAKACNRGLRDKWSHITSSLSDIMENHK